MEGVKINVSISEGIFIKNPLETNLGKKVISNAIELFCDLGYEEFNFKKLANKAETTEASVYRYFENKFRLLVYLSEWYWDFMYFVMMLDIRNLKNPHKKLKQAISTLVNSRNSILTPKYINQNKLHLIIIENASKVLHTKNVDELNKEGYYRNYKKIVSQLSQLIMEINSTYSFPVSLASILIEQSLNNEYYIEHLPNLTDKFEKPPSPADQTVCMLEYLIDRLM